jgi:hypothetical protein
MRAGSNTAELRTPPPSSAILLQPKLPRRNRRNNLRHKLQPQYENYTKTRNAQTLLLLGEYMCYERIKCPPYRAGLENAEPLDLIFFAACVRPRYVVRLGTREKMTSRLMAGPLRKCHQQANHLPAITEMAVNGAGLWFAGYFTHPEKKRTPFPKDTVLRVLETAWVTQHPPVRHPKNPVLGFHGWDETVPRGQFTWSVVFIFFWAFFSSYFFSPARCFFSWASFLLLLFLGHPWPHIVFWQLLPTPSTYLLHCLSPTHLPPSICFFLSTWFPPFPLTSIPSAWEISTDWACIRV